MGYEKNAIRFGRRFWFGAIFTFVLSFCEFVCGAQTLVPSPAMRFTISMPDPGSHVFHVVFTCKDLKKPLVDFRMAAWTPGYYQLMGYSRNLEHFTAKDGHGQELSWDKADSNTWKVQTLRADVVTLEYDIRTTKQFVAESWLDSTHAYIIPGSVCLYADGFIRNPVSVEVKPWGSWGQVATGLDSVAGQAFVYKAADFDVLFDSPLLIGNLERLPPFYVKGIPHYFTGYKMGDFDRVQLMNDLQKIVEAGVAVIGDIPYKHYTFIAIGPGRGGIEHLNSSAISFSGKELDEPGGRLRMLSFIAHEYFHHYNVKRIRPVALGPFDYQKENRTNMLWVSEGLTVYYEYLLVRRAGMMSREDLLKDFQRDISSYEKSPGHLYQSLTSASYETWSDGPFGRQDDKTISYYEKGPAVGMMLDFAIRHASGNKRNLDDVMRALYRQYYLERKRGFTDEEFQQACEKAAGASLEEIFTYASTVKEPDYAKYLGYAGLSIDPGSWQIGLLPNPDALQLAIRKSWLAE